MKKLAGLLLLLILFQNLNGQKYGYLNKDELYRSMPDFDSANVQIEKLRMQFQNQLAAMQNELSTKTTSLNNESAGISEFLRQNRQEELKSLDVRLQLFSIKANSQLEDKKNELLQPILTRVDVAIKAVAAEQGFIFVIDSGQLLYADEKKCTNILQLVKTKLGVKLVLKEALLQPILQNNFYLCQFLLFLFTGNQTSFAKATEDKTGCGAVGSVLRSGRRGRKFESSHPDKRKSLARKCRALFFQSVESFAFKSIRKKQSPKMSAANDRLFLLGHPLEVRRLT